MNKLEKTPYLFLFLAIILFVILTLYPIIDVIYLSFHKYNFITEEKEFVGLKEYISCINDYIFKTSIINTLYFSLAATFSQTLLGLGFAILVNRLNRIRKFLIPIIIAPNLLPVVVVISAWKLLMDYDHGLFNYILNSLGFEKVGWLFDPKIIWPSIIIIDTWQWTPVCFLILLAGLQSIPKDLYEAAMIDGASSTSLFSKITLPLLKPHLFLTLLLRSIDTFRIFEKVYLLTGGGPGIATETISTYIFKNGLIFFDLGKASAASVLMTLTIITVGIVYIINIMKRG